MAEEPTRQALLASLKLAWDSWEIEAKELSECQIALAQIEERAHAAMEGYLPHSATWNLLQCILDIVADVLPGDES